MKSKNTLSLFDEKKNVEKAQPVPFSLRQLPKTIGALALLMLSACNHQESWYEQVYVCGDKGWNSDSAHYHRPAHPEASHVAEGDEEIPRYGRSAGYASGIGPTYGLGMGGARGGGASASASANAAAAMNLNRSLR
jgi:hypothetical protein